MTGLRNAPRHTRLFMRLALAALLLPIPALAHADIPPTPERHTTTFPYFPLWVDGKNYQVPLVQVRFNDHTSASIIFDTGFTSSVISERMATRLNLKLLSIPSDVKATLIDPALTQYVYATLNIGEWRLANRPFYVVKTERLAFSRTAADAVLGCEILKDFAVLLDGPQHQITFTSPGSLQPSEIKTAGFETAAVIPLYKPDPYADFVVHGQVSNTLDVLNTTSPAQDFLIDTGCVTTSLSSNIAPTLALKPTETMQPHRNMYGMTQDNRAPLKTLQIGNLVFHNQPISYIAAGQGALATGQGGVTDRNILGIDLMSQARILFDFPAKKMYWQAVASPPAIAATPLISPSAPERHSTTFPYLPLWINGHDYQATLVPVSLNGDTSATMFLDTGSHHCFMTEFMVGLLKLTPKPIPQEIKATLTDPSLTEYVQATVNIGQAQLVDIPFFVIKTERLIFSPIAADAILGCNILKEFAILLDGPQHLITLTVSGNMQPSEIEAAGFKTAAVIPLLKPDASSAYLVHAQVSSTLDTPTPTSPAIDLLLDTGSVTTSINSSVAWLLGLKPTGTILIPCGYSAATLSTVAPLQTLQIGDMFIHNQPITYLTNEQRAMRGTIDKNRLGMDMLSQARVLIDFPAKKLYWMK